MIRHSFLFAGLAAAVLSSAAHAEDKKPTIEEKRKAIRALLVTGGCCHDYTNQKKIISEGVSARANVEWTLCQQGGSSTDIKIGLYQDENWAKGYDIVVHNECFANIPDPKWTQRILKPHQEGLPAVVIHCAMHSYRDKTDEWFKFVGVTSHRHGGHFAFEAVNLKKDHPIMEGFGDKWKTPKGELYHIAKVWDSATPLAEAYSPETKSNHVCIWTNQYGKTRVFGTTVGHYNEEMKDPIFLNYLTKGILWATDRLDDKEANTPAKELKVTEINPGKDEKPEPKPKPPADDKKKTDAGEQAPKVSAAYFFPPGLALPGKPGDTVDLPVNLAKGKPAKADGIEDEARNASRAVDGYANTRWSPPNGEAGHWWQVDLEKPQEIAGVRITWEQKNAPYQYKVEGSADGKAWSMLVDHTAPNPKQEQVHSHKVSAKDVRFVRISVTGVREGSWGTFWEVEVFGTTTEKVKIPEAKNATSLAPGFSNKGTAMAGSEATLAKPVEPPTEEALLKNIKVPAGYKATIFAMPPNVSYPTCVAAAPNGDLFVGIDENGSLGTDRKRVQRVVRCVDTDGDGKADKFTTFADKVESPRGLYFDPYSASAKGGTLYVLHPPMLRAFHDDDGDGVADRDEVIAEGIGFDLKFRGADHTTNGFRVGIDGWIYIAVGDYGFVKGKGKDGKTVQLRGGGVARVRLDGSDLEIYADGLRNIYDVAVSPLLDGFTRDNTNDGGGWNVRLSHIIGGGAHYGYPSLYKNFADEHVAALADYGGGSPCGSLFIDEPGLPGAFGRGLHTCDWGRGVVFFHPLAANGAGFKAEQQNFVQIDRPTDMDIDGSGRIFISTWRDGGFAFGHPYVGYVARIVPENFKPVAFPNLREAKDEELVKHLGSDSAVLRQYAQRETLRRGAQFKADESVAKLAADKQAALAGRVATIFTLRQLRGGAATDTLVALAKDESVREFAVRALADRPADASGVPLKLFVDGAGDTNPRVRLQAVIALGRLGRAEGAAALLPATADPDPLVAHAAVNSLVSLRAVDACLKAVAEGSPATVKGACAALKAIHEPAVVDGLIAALAKSRDPLVRQPILSALCRLHFKPATWTGKWWGTRPDTSGPYFEAVAWEQTPKIAAALKDAMAGSDAATVKFLLTEQLRNKIQSGDATSTLVSLAEKDEKFQSTAVDLLLERSPTPAGAIGLLEKIASNSKADASLRARALAAVRNGPQNKATFDAAVRSVLAFGAVDALDGDMSRAREDFARDARNAAFASDIAGLVASKDRATRELGYTMLLHVAAAKQAPKGAKETAHATIEKAWAAPGSSAELLRAIGQSGVDGFDYQVRAHLADKRNEVKQAAEFAAKQLRLDSAGPASNRPLIEKLKYEDVLADAQKEAGDPKLGGVLFLKQGCIACHTVTANEPPKGPFLGDVSTKYKRAEIIEAILKPSAKVAQGFVSHWFEDDEGNRYEGFIVREAGDEVEIRNVAGVSTVLKNKQISDRGKLETSIMPQGLADKLTVYELSSLLAYFESLKPGK